MFRPKFKFTYDEVRIIVMALVEFKNQLMADIISTILIQCKNAKRL